MPVPKSASLASKADFSWPVFESQVASRLAKSGSKQTRPEAKEGPEHDEFQPQQPT